MADTFVTDTTELPGAARMLFLVLSALSALRPLRDAAVRAFGAFVEAGELTLSLVIDALDFTGRLISAERLDLRGAKADLRERLRLTRSAIVRQIPSLHPSLRPGARRVARCLLDQHGTSPSAQEALWEYENTCTSFLEHRFELLRRMLRRALKYSLSALFGASPDALDFLDVHFDFPCAPSASGG